MSLRLLVASSALLIGALGTLAIGSFFWAGSAPELPKPPLTIRALDRDGNELASWGPAGARDCRPLPLDQLGEMMVSATLAVEDRRFFEHCGVDFLALARAAWQAIRRGRFVGGGSTITQQLVKRPGAPRSLLAKAVEIREALALERKYSKREILEAYLNTLPYGHGVVGAEAASQFYFQKSAAELSFAEALFLAGLPQAPTRHASDPAAAWNRFLRNARTVERRFGPAWAASLPLVPPAARFPQFHASRRLIAQAARQEMQAARRQASPLRTAIDARMQNFAESLTGAARAADGAEAILLVLENSTGFVRACASTCEVLPRRSPGSLLKPFVYLHALEKRVLNAATRLSDDPRAAPFPDYQPRNYDRREFGEPTVRTALACSLNRPAVRALALAGPRESFQRLVRWGFAPGESFTERGAGFVLGNFEASPLEIAAAYAALARGGEAWAPRWTALPPREIMRAAEAPACALVADILADPIARRPSFGAGSPLELPFRAAVKTGTSSNFRDGWCAGFDADHTVVVWRGRADGASLGERLAVQTAAPLWHRMMVFLASLGSRPWPELQEADELHLLELPESKSSEWFLAGTGPSEKVSASAQPEILFPREGTVFECAAGISVERQKILPVSRPSARAWRWNHQPIPEGGIPLVPGQHQLTAQFEDRELTIHFRVEAP